MDSREHKPRIASVRWWCAICLWCRVLDDDRLDRSRHGGLPLRQNLAPLVLP